MLYDLTSTWLTGRCCELAARGHSRDGKRDEAQIVFGLICTAEGCPIAVEVFKGNTADPAKDSIILDTAGRFTFQEEAGAAASRSWRSRSW